MNFVSELFKVTHKRGGGGERRKTKQGTIEIERIKEKIVK